MITLYTDDPMSFTDAPSNCIAVSVSFSLLMITPILGLLCRSTSTQLKAISMHLLTCSEYASNA